MKSALIVPTLVLLSVMSLARTSQFPQAPQYSAAGAYSIAVSDFNGDGKADLVVGANNTIMGDLFNAITVLLGNGDGTFKTPVLPTLYCTPQDVFALVQAVAAADVNNDGKSDIIATEDDGSLCVFLGNGDGTFQAPLMLSVGNNLVALGVGDFNGDGKLDVAVADSASAGVIDILLGNGDGTFVLRTSNTVFYGAPPPLPIAVGDLNHDGKADLAIGTGVVLLGRGDGTFKKTYLPGVPGTASSLVIADFNGDGNPDLAMANSSATTNDISILFGNGDGTFQNAINHALDLPPTFVTAGDLNHDGEPDLAIVNLNGAEILLNSDHGSFGAPVTYAADKNPTTLVIADFNVDKNPDLAVTNGLLGESVTILLGNGDGTFLGPMKQTVSPVSSGMLPAAVGDFNQDGRADVAVATDNGVSVLLAGKNGILKSPVTYGTNASYVAVGDLNRDGKPDLITLTGNSIGIMLGKGNGQFHPQATYAANASSLALGDFNGDGNLDVAVTSASGITVYLGNGNGTLGQSFTSSANGAQGPMAVGDFNGDKKLDLAVLNGSVTVLLGNGDGTFGAPVTYFTDLSFGSLVSADLNADGKPDLVLAANYGAQLLYVALGNGDGTFQTPVSYPSGGLTNSLAVADFNGDGKLDVAAANPIPYGMGGIFGGNVAVFLGNGDGTLQVGGDYIAGTWPYWVGAADLNGDGAPDLVSLSNAEYTAPLSLTVFLNLSGTALSITSSQNPSPHGQLVTFTVTVRASVHELTRPVPTGSVSFHDEKTVLGKVTLKGGKAEFSTAKLSVGTHSITAQYSGNNHYNPHTSAVLKQVVKK